MAPRGGPLAGLGRAAEQSPPRTQAGPGLSHRLRASRTDCITSARAWDSSPAEGPEDSPSGLKGWVRSWAREWRRNSAACAGAEVGASLRAPPWRHFRGAQLEFAASMATKGALSIGVAGQPQGGKQGRGRGASRPRTGELLGARRRRPYNRRRLLKIKTSASRHSDQTTAAAGGRQKPCHRRLGGGGEIRGTPRVPAGAGLRPQPHGPRPPPPPKKLAETEPGARLPRMRRRDTTDLTKRSATWVRTHATRSLLPGPCRAAPRPLRSQASPVRPAERGGHWVSRWASGAHPGQGAESPEARRVGGAAAPARCAGSALLADQAWSRASFCPGSSFPSSRY
ncbi:translation initiation factor IF-2-like [Leopardus geoffroyi]|uniref:translation initiation factor IF-2-like n=1 Tax=Leopardus geoffroyi TaxID=46844 RepID=UPI001E263B93|nr:translation initiation factor IF-2-like [Leopardus geoffroyi]